MARKLTRYKVNRQFRKNPTRSRVFFPRKLPFQRDFRLVDSVTDMEVGFEIAENWNKVVQELSEKGKTGNLLSRGAKRKLGELAAGAATSTAISKVMRNTAKKMRGSQSVLTRQIIPEIIESYAFILSPFI